MSLKPIQFLIIACMIFIVSACGKSKGQEVKDAVRSANILLSTKQCQQAIDLLEGIGRQNRDANYLKVLSSSYACRAGYSTITFFGTDISKTATPSPLGGVTTYATSQIAVTAPLVNDSNYKDLQEAINILLYAGGISASTEPTASERTKYFSSGPAGDINTELAFMMMVQLGKFMRVYANASIAGVKGGGSAANNCFTDYSTTPVAIQTYVTSVLPGACNSVSSSHTQLALGLSGRRVRLCQGVVLMNSILDVLPSVLAAAGGGSTTDLATVTSQINTQKAFLITAYPTIGPTATVMSQYNCENDGSIDVNTLASYYAILFEGIIQ
ncbi:MAG: hypothetical protein H7336_15945 [Bacteriovorax sp.]|nr:hypothetical protein [Bacteriovorax sp.]